MEKVDAIRHGSCVKETDKEANIEIKRKIQRQRKWMKNG